MGKTTNLGLHTTATDETSKTFLAYRTELSGTEPDSNMNIIDKAYGDMDTKIDTINDTLDAKIDANKQTETSKFSALDSTISGIQSSLSQEVSDRTSGDQLLQAQIDQLVAPTGEAPNPAEIINARIGWDAKTYESLGDAIRGQVTDLSTIFRYNWQAFRWNGVSYTIQLGGSLTRSIFDAVYLEAGQYTVFCTQTGELSSVDRNRFYYNKHGDTKKTYEANDNLTAGTHSWSFTIAESDYYDIDIWVANPSSEVSITDFMLCSITADNLLLRLNRMLPSAIGIPYGIEPLVSKSGNTLTVTFPGDSPIIMYLMDTGHYNWKYITKPADPIVVEDTQMLFYDIDAGEFVVKSSAANVSFDITDSKYIFCFLNKGGAMLGPWTHIMEVQRLENSISMNGLVYFRNGGRPTFARSGNDYTITFPNDTVVYSAFYSTQRVQVWRYATSPAESISLPNNSVLYYDISTDSFGVSTGSDVSFDILSSKIIILCYNVVGQIVGPWSKYLVEDKIDEISDQLSEILDDNLPSYYTSYLSDKINSINTQILDMGEGDAFVFITDIHIDGNTMHSPKLIKNIINETPINKVFLNGDYIQQEPSKAGAMTKINRLLAKYRYTDAMTFVAVGNHEFNTNGTYQPAPELTWQELRDTLRKDNENIIVEQEDGLGYIYIDQKHKIKYMVATMNASAGMDLASIKFIGNNLQNTPSGYTIVIMNHGGIRSDLTYQNGFDELVDLADAVRNKTTIDFQGETMDFANADYTVACIITGHYHDDFYKITESGMPIISVTTDAQLYDNTGVDRTVGTVNEQAFDVFCIDTENQIINTIRIGAGNNRYYSYAPT